MGKKASLMKTSLMLVGPFAFIEALLFRPRMLTPYLSGRPDVVPMELQTMASVLVLLAVCLGSRRLVVARPQIAAAISVGASFACAVAIASVQAIWVPVVVACLLAAACGLLLQTVLGRCPFDPSSTLEDYGLSAAVTLCVSSLAAHIGYWLAPNDAYGTMILAIMVGASGVLACLGMRRVSPVVSGVGVGRVRSDRDGLAHLKLDALFRTLAPVVPAGLICSLSLGMSSGDMDMEPLLRSGIPFALGCAATLAVLAAIVARWRRHSEERNDDVALFMAVPCALAIVAAVVASAVDFRWVFAVLVCSNLTFLSLLWIDMLFLTSRRLFVSSAAPVAALVAVLLVFFLGMLLSGVLPASLVTVLAPLAAVAYLVYLVFYFQRKTEEGSLSLERMRDGRPVEPEASRLSFDEIRFAACRAMAEEYGLSPKEAEVLPLLVTGISAAAIGRQLFISHETVKTHKYHIYQKLGTHNYEETLEMFLECANGVNGSER